MTRQGRHPRQLSRPASPPCPARPTPVAAHDLTSRQRQALAVALGDLLGETQAPGRQIGGGA